MPRLSGRITPSMFQGGPTLSEIALVTVPLPVAPLSSLMTRLAPDCVTENVCPGHGDGSASQRYVPPRLGRDWARTVPAPAAIVMPARIDRANVRISPSLPFVP